MNTHRHRNVHEPALYWIRLSIHQHGLLALAIAPQGLRLCSFVSPAACFIYPEEAGTEPVTFCIMQSRGSSAEPQALPLVRVVLSEPKGVMFGPWGQPFDKGLVFSIVRKSNEENLSSPLHTVAVSCASCALWWGCSKKLQSTSILRMGGI